MKNKFNSICYRCGEKVKRLQGFVEIRDSQFLTQHKECYDNAREVRKLIKELAKESK